MKRSHIKEKTRLKQEIRTFGGIAKLTNNGVDHTLENFHSSALHRFRSIDYACFPQPCGLALSSDPKRKEKPQFQKVPRRE